MTVELLNGWIQFNYGWTFVSGGPIPGMSTGDQELPLVTNFLGEPGTGCHAPIPPEPPCK